MKFILVFVLFSQSSLLFASSLTNRMEGFSNIESSNANFVETWNAEYLDEPLISKGDFFYKRPSKLTKIVIEPARIEQHVDSDNVSILHDGELHTVSLLSQPEMATGIYALQAVLDGNEEQLSKLFSVDYSEDGSVWSLKLMPKDKSVSDVIEFISIVGHINKLKRIHIQFYNGDSLITDISHEK